MSFTFNSDATPLSATDVTDSYAIQFSGTFAGGTNYHVDLSLSRNDVTPHDPDFLAEEVINGVIASVVANVSDVAHVFVVKNDNTSKTFELPRV